MASVSFKSFGPAQFEQYSQQIRAEGGEITQQQAGEVAEHFKVPLGTVLKLREELLSSASKTTEQVGQQTREQREMAGGWRQPVGMAQVNEVGVNPFMFKNLDDNELRQKVDEKMPDFSWKTEADKVDADNYIWPGTNIVLRYGFMPAPSPESGKEAMGKYLAAKKPLKGEPVDKAAIKVLDRGAGKLYQLMDQLEARHQTGYALEALGKATIRDSVFDKLSKLPQGEQDLALAQRPVTDLDGVGAKVGARLKELGIKTVHDLAKADAGKLRYELMTGTGRTEAEIMDSIVDPKPILDLQEKLIRATLWYQSKVEGFGPDQIVGTIKSLHNTRQRAAKAINDGEKTPQEVVDALTNFCTAQTHLARYTNSEFSLALGLGGEVSPELRALLGELRLSAAQTAGLEPKIDEVPQSEPGTWWGRCDRVAKRLLGIIDQSFTGARYADRDADGAPDFLDDGMRGAMSDAIGAEIMKATSEADTEAVSKYVDQLSKRPVYLRVAATADNPSGVVEISRDQVNQVLASMADDIDDASKAQKE